MRLVMYDVYKCVGVHYAIVAVCCTYHLCCIHIIHIHTSYSYTPHILLHCLGQQLPRAMSVEPRAQRQHLLRYDG